MDPYLRNTALSTIENLDDLNNEFSNKRILITGAGGFLGANFIHYFLCLNDKYEHINCKIIGWDNLIRGKPNWLDHIAERNDFEFKCKSILETIDISSVDFIIHAASIASPIFYRKFPIETMDTNVNGIRNILEYALNNDVQSILYLSSSEVYGNPQKEYIPTPETYEGIVSCIGPRACYDESKRFGETLCVNFYKQHNIPVKIVRPFNVYGVGLNYNDGRVMSDFFRDAIQQKKVVLYSDGKATRTFCYISDAISGFIRALLSKENGEVFNIGNQQPEINMLELAEMISELTEAEIIHENSVDKEYNTDNPQRRCPDMLKSKTVLNFEAKISLKEGLKLTYEYYKNQIASNH